MPPASQQCARPHSLVPVSRASGGDRATTVGIAANAASARSFSHVWCAGTRRSMVHRNTSSCCDAANRGSMVRIHGRMLCCSRRAAPGSQLHCIRYSPINACRHTHSRRGSSARHVYCFSDPIDTVIGSSSASSSTIIGNFVSRRVSWRAVWDLSAVAGTDVWLRLVATDASIFSLTLACAI